MVSGELWGVIGAQWTGERAPPADTEERMSKFAQLLGTAIANTESRVEVERLAQEQAALRRVATLVADEAPQEEVLAAIAAEIGPLIGIEETRLVRFVDDRSAVTIASAGSSDDFPVGELLPADPGSGTPLARVLATGESVSFDPYTPGDGPVAATLRRMGIRSGVCAPIYVEGRLWGSINTGSQQEALARDAESRLAQFTDLLETAIANTEARAEVQRLAQEQAALRRVATLVAEHPQSEELISAVAREVAGVMDVRGVIVERFEADGSQVIVGRAYDGELAGADALLGVGVCFPLHPGTLGAEVFATQRAARVEDYATLEGMMGDAARAVGIGSGCAVPIVVDGRLWGQMCVYSRQGTVLPAGTEHQLDEFVQLVATAISNYDARASLRTLAAEQAALRRVATLVAKGVEPEEVFAAVADETAATIQATTAVLRFEHDPPGVVLVGVSTETDGIDLSIGSRWDVDDVLAAAKVYRTRRSARVNRAECSSHRGPIGEAFRRLGIVSTAASPIIVEGRLWGVVAVNAREELPPDAEQRLERFTDLVTTAIANAEGKSELAASRARIAAAADDERRRVVRDLHDGAQQRLVHTVINLKLAQQALAKGAEDAPLLVQEAIGNAEQATAELRELAHGILPSALTHGGLRAGVDALGSRTPVPVKIDVAVDRLPTPVEATAYFVAAEALTNMAKHSSAAQAEVVAQIEDGMLRVEVRDDGVGGARPDGSGLVGLADRLAVLDGRLEVHSPPGGGTRLTALIPLAG